MGGYSFVSFTRKIRSTLFHVFVSERDQRKKGDKDGVSPLEVVEASLSISTPLEDAKEEIAGAEITGQIVSIWSKNIAGSRLVVATIRPR